MSRELDLLAKEFSKTPVTVMRTEVNLHETNINMVLTEIRKTIQNSARKTKNANMTLIYLINR
jgi:hypothetical protein